MNCSKNTYNGEIMDKLVYIRRHVCLKMIDTFDYKPYDVVDATLNSYVIRSKKDFGSSDENYITSGNKGSFWLNNNHKNKIKLGKLLSATTNLTPLEIEECVSKWKAKYEVNTSVIKISDDIGEVYNISSCGGSCMANKHKDFFEIYKDIGSKIAYIEKDGELLARALLHTLTNLETGEEMKCIDRIFFSNEEHKITMEEWARENGYTQIYNKDYQLVSSEIQEYYNKVPYVDTISAVVCNADGIYRLCTNKALGNSYNHLVYVDALQETDGSSSERRVCDTGENSVYCVDIDEYVDIEEAYYCLTDEEYYSNYDRLIYIESDSYEYGYYHEDDDRLCYRVDSMDYGFKEDSYEDIDGDWYADIDELVGIDGELYNTNRYDVVYCIDIDEYRLEEDAYYAEDTKEWYSDNSELYLHENGCYYTYEEEEEYEVA